MAKTRCKPCSKVRNRGAVPHSSSHLWRGISRHLSLQLPGAMTRTEQTLTNIMVSCWEPEGRVAWQENMVAYRCAGELTNGIGTWRTVAWMAASWSSDGAPHVVDERGFERRPVWLRCGTAGCRKLFKVFVGWSKA